MTKRYIPKLITNNKYTCKKCGKRFFHFGITEFDPICKRMMREKICWECAWWEWVINHPLDHMEIIGNQCYQVFPFIDKEEQEVGTILGGKGKKHYLLRKDGSCIRSNDVWWIGEIPWRFQNDLPPTGWWVTRRYYESLSRSHHQCEARACMDRYNCYRYKYQIEFNGDIYPAPPHDWIIGSEHCPAFLSLLDIKDYDEYVKLSDITNENEKVLNTKDN